MWHRSTQTRQACKCLLHFVTDYGLACFDKFCPENTKWMFYYLLHFLPFRVSPSLVKRRKTHFHRLPCGAHVILGNNGYIWISPWSVSEEETGGFAQNISVVPKDERIVVARLRNTVMALAKNGISLWDTSLTYGYDASEQYQPEELLREEVMTEVAQVTKQKLEFVTLEN